MTILQPDPGHSVQQIDTGIGPTGPPVGPSSRSHGVADYHA